MQSQIAPCNLRLHCTVPFELTLLGVYPVNGSPIAPHGLILRQDGAATSRMLFRRVWGQYKAILGQFRSNLNLWDQKSRKNAAINILAARGGRTGVSLYKNTVIYGIFTFPDFSGHFWILYGILEGREVSKNLPGACGFVVIQYEPIPSHGDPIRAQNDRYWSMIINDQWSLMIIHH